MDMQSSIGNFHEEICSFRNKYNNRDLEEYLLALYGVLLARQKEPPTLPFFLELLSDAFTAVPHAFNHNWLKQVTEPDVEESGEPSKQFSYALDVITFQVAELHKMRGKQLLDELRYMVIASETNHYWANFDPFNNLECGSGWMVDIKYSAVISWATLGLLLEMGRQYE
jgi:hypothetical protein